MNATPQEHHLPAKAQNPWRRFLLPLLLAGLLALGWAFGVQNYLSLEAIAQNREVLAAQVAARPLASALLYMVVYVLAVAVSFPGASLLTILAGLLFGWLLGGALAVVAATLGASILFLAARGILADVLAKKAGPRLLRLSEGFAKDAFSYLLFLRLVPAFPFWLVNIAPAFAKVRLGTFAGATLLGIIPATFAFAYVGVGLNSVLDAQVAARKSCLASKPADACAMNIDLSTLVTPQLLAALAGLGLVALAPVALRKWKSRHAV
jgi:uncharacterized membrane protein YdjX (TVP38/TMEM64 family)